MPDQVRHGPVPGLSHPKQTFYKAGAETWMTVPLT